jgi:uncharacterized membrane protein YccC
MFRHVMATQEITVREGYHIEHPNRDKASSKVTKLIIILLLLASAALVLIVTLGGWEKLAGAKAVQVAYVAIYVIMAYYVARWHRGVLPMAAALAILLGIFAAIAGPEWFVRDKPGYTAPKLDEPVVGLVTWIIVPVQFLLIAFAMRGFTQAWNVEVEVRDGEHYRPGMVDDEGRRTAPA